MLLRRAVGLLCLLCLSGCGNNAPPASQPASTSESSGPAANAVVANRVDAADTPAPVAKLLGKPVYRSDCLSKSSGIGSVEVGIHRLVLGVLMQDFCAGQDHTLTQSEIDAFWQRLQSLIPKQNKSPPAPSFNEQQVQAKFDETRNKLASPNVGWLERLVLEGQERGQLFALEHKSVPATVAYSELMPMKCINEVYKRYGGKVVARQISIEPAEAYLKMAQEAEQQGKLEFLDEGLKQRFWKRMNDDVQHPAVPPERVDFTIPAIFQLAPRNSGTSG